MLFEHKTSSNEELKRFMRLVLIASNKEDKIKFVSKVSEISDEYRDLISRVVVHLIKKYINTKGYDELKIIQDIIINQLNDYALVHFFRYYSNEHTSFEEKQFMEECICKTKVPPIYTLSLFLTKGDALLLPLIKKGINTLEKKEYLSLFISVLSEANIKKELLDYCIKELESNLLRDDFNLLFNKIRECQTETILKRYLYFFEKKPCTKTSGLLIRAITVNDDPYNEWKIKLITDTLIKMGCCENSKRSNKIIESLVAFIGNENRSNETKEYLLDILYDINTNAPIFKKRVMKHMVKVFYTFDHLYAEIFFDMLGDKDALDFLKSYKIKKNREGRYLPPSVNSTIQSISSWLNQKDKIEYKQTMTPEKSRIGLQITQVTG